MDNVEIKQCGYFAPGDMNPGDHSLLEMDILYNSVLGHSPILPQTFKARQLCLYDSKTTEKYLCLYRGLLHSNNAIDRQVRLHKSAQYGVPLTPAQAIEADSIDNLFTNATLTAEKKCGNSNWEEYCFPW